MANQTELNSIDREEIRRRAEAGDKMAQIADANIELWKVCVVEKVLALEKRDALEKENAKLRLREKDLAMIVGLLAIKLPKEHPTRQKAETYLSKHKLLSPLRGQALKGE